MVDSRLLRIHEATLEREAVFEGIGVHSGRPSKLTISPSEAGSGVLWRREEWPSSLWIRADSAHVVGTQNATSIGEGEHTLSTIEHAMAALFALGVDNARLSLEGLEVPILGGGSAEYVEGLRASGARLLRPKKRYLFLQKPFELQDFGGSYSLKPSRSMKISLSLRLSEAAHAGFLRESDWAFEPQTYAEGPSLARTFGYLSDLETLRQRGLAQGSSLENSLPLDHPEALSLAHSPLEPLWHKITDLLGDLFLLNGRLVADVSCVQPSHALNVALGRGLLASGALIAREFENLGSFEREVEASSFAFESVMPVVSVEF